MLSGGNPARSGGWDFFNRAWLMSNACFPNSDRCAISVRLLPFRLLLGAVAGVLCFGAVPAAAQSSFEPAAIERTITGQISATSDVPIVLFQAREPIHSQATGRFTLGAVNIDGATVFSKKELTAYFEPLLASDVD